VTAGGTAAEGRGASLCLEVCGKMRLRQNVRHWIIVLCNSANLQQ